MGEVIRQNPIRMKAGLLIFLGVLAAALTKGALRLFSSFDPSQENLVAAGAGVALAAALALRLRLRFPTFTVTPSMIQGIERSGSGRIYRLRLSTGETRRVAITGKPGREGTAQQLLRVLPGSMLSSTQVSNATSGTPGLTGAASRGPWRQITRAEAFAELRAIAEGRPVQHDEELAPASSMTGSTHPTSRSTSAEPAATRPSHTAEYLEQRDGSAPPEVPDSALRQQWEKDDEYAEEKLKENGVRNGSFGWLRFLTWMVMFASIYYLASDIESDGMSVSFILWTVAFAIGTFRGALLDLRAAKSRRVAQELMRDHLEIERRGMPEPWIRAARWTPSATARMLRATTLLLFIFFLIGLSGVGLTGEANRTARIGILIVLAFLLLTWILLSVFIGRRTKRNKHAADEHAGARLYWIEHPEQLADHSDGSDLVEPE